MKSRTRNPLTRTPWIGFPTSSCPRTNSPATQIPLTLRASVHGLAFGCAGISSTVPPTPEPAPRRVMSSFWIVSVSRNVPGATTIVSPGRAASIAAWIDSPAWTRWRVLRALPVAAEACSRAGEREAGDGGGD